MKTLYIQDIPENYKYARFGSNYIDLFDTNQSGENVLYYRYYYDTGLYFTDLENNFLGSSVREIPVSNDWHYREDYPNIITAFFIIAFSLILLVNWFTKPIKKGGIIF